eukprot:Anaeramoba_ignava/a2539_57.p1 GENE.a2539_57~~a2539_57.p1  ORF type:complete len:962 (-),score=298.27 a2539_57:315-3200(-)
MTKAVLYKQIDNGRVKCCCCNHRCTLTNFKSGKCRARRNRDGDLFLEISGFLIKSHFESINYGMIGNFLPNEKAFFIGTLGRNLSCKFHKHCVNEFLPKKTDREIEDIYKGDPMSPEDIIKKCEENECRIIVFAYYEPTIYSEYAVEIAKLAKQKEIKTIYITNGYMTQETIEYIFPHINAVNVNLHSFRNSTYQKLTNARLAPILKNIERFYKLGVWVEITTPITPELNDKQEELEEIAQFISSLDPNIPWHIAPHYGLQTPIQESILEKAREIGEKEGLNFIYTYNYNKFSKSNPVNSEENKPQNINNIICPNCREIVAKRTNTKTEYLEMSSEGKCAKCSQIIPGIWDSKTENLLVPKIEPNSPEAQEIIWGSGIQEQQKSFFEDSKFDRDHRVLILFGTQTGTSEEYAHQLMRSIQEDEKAGGSFDVRVVDLDNYPSHLLLTESLVIIVTSTFGEGQPPTNAMKLYDFIKNQDPKKTPFLLENLKFAIFGLGSSMYTERYQKFARFLDSRLEELGAKKLHRLGEGDVMKSIDEPFSKWTQSLLNKLIKKHGASKTGIVSKKSQLEVVFEDEMKKNANIKEKDEKPKIDTTEKIHLRLVNKKELLNYPPQENRNCKHLEFEIIGDEKRIFESGDHIGIHPPNPIELVEKFGKLLKIDLNRKIQIHPFWKHEGFLSIREVLTKDYNLTYPVNQNKLKSLSKHCVNLQEQEELYKLSKDPMKYDEWMIFHQRGIVDVFENFPHIELSFSRLFELLSKQPMRFYSISSSPKISQKKFTLTVQVMENGLCSNFLANMKEGTEIEAHLQKSSFQVDHSKPLVTISTGTGFAPIRAVIQDRTTMDKKELGWLNVFYGARTAKMDAIYKEEIDQLKNQGFINEVFYAFSRDQKEKIYVQHLLRKQSQLVISCVNEGGSILVCGQIEMGLEIQSVLKEILGEKTFSDFSQTGRFFLETWNSGHVKK